MNELTLFSEPQEPTITTKELATMLNVEPRTIQLTVQRLNLANVLSQVKINGKFGYVYTEEQATLIKQEIQKHHNLQSRQIDSVQTQLEENQTILKALTILKTRNDELQRKVNEDAPKVEVYQMISDATNLTEVGIVAKMLGTGRNRLFRWLHENNILYSSSNNKNIPYQKYDQYLKVKEKPFKKGTTPELYAQIFFTGEGIEWITKLYKESL